MVKHFKSGKVLIAFVSIAMLLTTVFALGRIEAEAASLATPSVTLTNTSTTSIKVSWKKVSGASKYTVYRSLKSNSGFKAVATTTSLSSTSTKLTCGKKYYFKVKAINGKASKMSAVKSKVCAPAKPTGLKATNVCTGLNVSWSKVSGASGYQLYYATSASGSYKSLKTQSGTSYKHTGIGTGKTRYYKVRAYKTVKGKKVYGDFCAVVSKKTDHVAASSWTITKKATCAKTGSKTNTCKYCKKKYTVTIPKDTTSHKYTLTVVPEDDVYEEYNQYKCSVCGDIYVTNKIKHKYNTITVAPNCTEKGYTYDECKNCHHTTEARNVIPAMGKEHLYSEPVCDEESGFTYSKCSKCGNEKYDTVCYIDLTNQTVSNPKAASFNYSSSKTEGAFDKLDLIYYEIENPFVTGGKKLVADYEIIGDATDLTIDVNAVDDMDIKLAGVSIINSGKDCFDVKNKALPLEDGTITTPEVSISIKDGTENFLISAVSGNAIETSCELTIKGHGAVTMDTVSTTISAAAKVNIKNADINIISKNRGIDTKTDQKNDAGLIVTTLYYNVKIYGNANITIDSVDDCIRCKNMEIAVLTEDEVDSVLNLTSAAGDGIQLEGNKGFEAHSGIVKISAGKYAFNCKSALIAIDGSAKLDVSGNSGISKP